MKEVSMIPASGRLLRFIMLVMLLIPAFVFGQTDSAAANETAKEEESLISPSIDFITVQKSDKTIDLKAEMKAKIKGTFFKLHLLKVSFFQVTDTAEKNLGFVITDANGKAKLNVKEDAIVTGADGSIHLKAVFAGNKQMDPADGEVTVKRAWLEIVPAKEDSLYTVKAKLIVPGSETDSAIKDLTVGIFVKRSINPLKLGEGTTDESGEVTVEIPGNLPGDEQGNITLLARLDENEIFGNLEAAAVQKWGTAVSYKIEDQPRALWSSHPPLWMLITFIIMMSVVWGHFIVIVYQLFRLRKEEPAV